LLIKKSFKTKLIFSYLCIIIVPFAFVAFFLDQKLEEHSLCDIKSSLVYQARLIESQIPLESLQKEDTVFLETLMRALSQKIKCRITIVGIKGNVLADSEKTLQGVPGMENHLYRPEVRDALTGAVGIHTRYSSTLKIDMLYVAVPMKEKDKIIGILRLALPLGSIQRALSDIRKIIFLGLLFALGLALVLGSFLASGTIRPIRRMIQTSRKFSEGDFTRRIISCSQDEIGELAVTLNKMAQDLEDKIREIKTQNQKLAAIFNSMAEGVIVVDRMGHIASINPAIEKIFSVSKNEVKGSLFLEAIRNNEIAEVISHVLKTGQAASGEVNLLLPVRKLFQFNAAPIFDNNIVSGCLVVIHDITEIRKLETVRSDFVANVSHELKTPLTSIKGFVETLLEGALDDKENNRHFLKIIQNHAERLNNLVEDLLSLSHLESREITIEKKDFNLRQQMEDVALGFKSQLKKKNIEMRNELPLSFCIKADKNRIEQVFTNFIDNAIKFNKEEGFIKVTSSEDDDKIKITIEDSGIGIPEKDIPRIFERFYRVDKARSRELGGTGLGLSIVKHIVELHGGIVGVESIEGLGSKFWLILPK